MSRTFLDDPFHNMHLESLGNGRMRSSSNSFDSSAHNIISGSENEMDSESVPDASPGMFFFIWSYICISLLRFCVLRVSKAPAVRDSWYMHSKKVFNCVCVGTGLVVLPPITCLNLMLSFKQSGTTFSYSSSRSCVRARKESANELSL